MGIGSHHSAASKSDTYLTPPEIIQALGPFSIDPCAAPEPRPWPTAERHICLPDDGLMLSWGRGMAWVNPPYGRDVGLWMDRLSQHPDGGIALVFARTETEWFVQHVWRCPTATAALWLFGRITFRDRNGDLATAMDKKSGLRKPANSGGPSVLVAYGRAAAARLMASKLDGAFTMIGRCAL
jgi:hypothetical protein